LPDRYRHYRQAYFEAQRKSAALYFRQAQYEQALAVYQRLIQVYPRDATLFFYLGLCHEKSGDEKAAQQAFQTALQLNPYHPKAQKHYMKFVRPNSEINLLCEKARMLTQEEKYAEAITLLKQAANLDPYHPKPYHYLFNVY